MEKIIALLIVLLIVPSIVFATIDTGDYSITPGGEGTSKVTDIGKILVSALRGIGIIVAVASLIIMGARLMVAAPGEKASIKEGMTPFIVGAVMLVTITSILDYIALVVG